MEQTQPTPEIVTWYTEGSRLTVSAESYFLLLWFSSFGVLRVINVEALSCYTYIVG